MCGRYALYGPVSRLREAFDAVPEGFEFEPRWNAAPLQWLPVVRQRSNGEEIDTFTIVTTEANAAMRPLHDRMPVILAPGDWWAWLNGATAADQVQALLRPCPEAALAAYPVSTAVGSVRNDAPALIQPV